MMLVRNVKQGMILQLTESGHNSVIQALEDCRLKNDSYHEFNAVDLVSGVRLQVGAANPAQAYAPGLCQVGWACSFA
jgi:hypothetical protein